MYFLKINIYVNMNLLNLVKNLLNTRKNINKKELPSQGLFYQDDFEISIKKADFEDIIEYEVNFSKENIGLIIYKVKTIVEKNIILSNNYAFEDIKSIDVVYIFLEIVKFTKDKPIKINYIDEETGYNDTIEFNTGYFNYFKISEKLMNCYNKDLKCFVIDDYKFSLPTIGIENSLTNFLIIKQTSSNNNVYSNYFYEFTYFLLDKNKLGFADIENLIQIFNFDIEPEELKKVKNILKTFQPMQKYSLIKNSRVIDINSRIDLENIWK